MPSVATILNNAPIACVLSQNDVDKGALYGKRLDPELPVKIYATYKVIKKIYDYSPVVLPVNATGSIQITAIGNVGDDIQVLVNDPFLGSISLGVYTQVSGDTDTTILAGHIAAELNSNGYGYYVTSATDTISITARLGIGSSINGGGRLTAIGSNTSEILAQALISGLALGSTGFVYTVTSAEPIAGIVTLASYTQQSSDSTLDILAASIMNAINIGVSGYYTQGVTATTFYILSRSGLGSSINGYNATISWNTSSTTSAFSGGAYAVTVIPHTITQFSGGVTGVELSTAIIATSNYLWELMGRYGIRALAYTGGGGGSVSPVTPDEVATPITIGSSDFTDATHWNKATYAGKPLVVFSNGIARYLTFSTEWGYTSTGIVILIAGFDSAVMDYTLVITIIR